MEARARYRRSLRIRDFDYAQGGAYFVTICIQDRACLLGEIVDGVVALNGAGRMIQEAWDQLAARYRGVETDAAVVMPNHLHGIILLVGGETAPDADKSPDLRLGEVVHRFKSLTTRHYSEGVKSGGWPPFRGRLWQRNYFEHVIRDFLSLERIRDYIAANPVRWDADSENPNRRDDGRRTLER